MFFVWAQRSFNIIGSVIHEVPRWRRTSSHNLKVVSSSLSQATSFYRFIIFLFLKVWPWPILEVKVDLRLCIEHAEKE